jgi:hypothetical protein
MKFVMLVLGFILGVITTVFGIKLIASIAASNRRKSHGSTKVEYHQNQ